MLDLTLDADPPAGDSDSTESATSETSVGNQDVDDFDEEDEINFTADTTDDINNAVSNALNDATSRPLTSPPLRRKLFTKGTSRDNQTMQHPRGAQVTLIPVGTRYLPLLSG